MGAEAIAALAIQYGLPFVTYLISLGNKPVTAEEWAHLLMLANVSAKDEAVARLTAAGISLDSEKAKQLLALMPK